MRWRVLFIASLVVNICLGAAWFFSTHPAPGVSEAPASSSPAEVKTNVVVRRQFFTWSEVESPDYPVYIANLRAIGCPEQTIRDIIIAEINAVYAKRRATEVTTPEQQWWRSEPDPMIVQTAARKLRDLEEERHALLTRLLGPDWESGDLASLPRPSRPGIALDGPVLGVMSAEAKQAVEDASVRAQAHLQEYLQSQQQQGKNADPEELAKLRQQTRNELAGILTPQQLEEYLLRYSQGATDLRNALGELKYFNATSNEFRSVFRATDSIDLQIQLLGDGNDANTVLARNSLLQQRENAVKQALGPARYEQYTLLHDPAYQDAWATAQQAGTPDAAKTIYELNVATAQQRSAIRANTNLSPAQMAIELKRAELEQLKAAALATGQELPPEPATTEANTNVPPAAPPIPSHVYVIGPGESAASIATLYGVPIDSIQAANPGVNIQRLRPGETIRVPDSLPGR